MKEYREKLAVLERVAPHVYALADAAYTNLRSEGKNQSVIISGESGAGTCTFYSCASGMCITSALLIGLV